MLKVTCAIIIQQNKILVTQRNASSDHPLKWEFPGGKIKSGETLEKCIIREIKEELEIDINIMDSMITIKHDYGFKQIELIPFICNIKSGKVNLTDHQDFRWVSLEEICKVDFLEADEKLIQQHQNKITLKKYLRKNMNNS